MAKSSGVMEIVMLVVLIGGFVLLWPQISGALNAPGTAGVGAVDTAGGGKASDKGGNVSVGGNGGNVSAGPGGARAGGGGTTATAGGGGARACAGGKCVSAFGEMKMGLSNIV